MWNLESKCYLLTNYSKRMWKEIADAIAFVIKRKKDSLLSVEITVIHMNLKWIKYYPEHCELKIISVYIGLIMLNSLKYLKKRHHCVLVNTISHIIFPRLDIIQYRDLGDNFVHMRMRPFLNQLVPDTGNIRDLEKEVRLYCCIEGLLTSE